MTGYVEDPNRRGRRMPVGVGDVDVVFPNSARKPAHRKTVKEHIDDRGYLSQSYFLQRDENVNEDDLDNPTSSVTVKIGGSR